VWRCASASRRERATVLNSEFTTQLWCLDALLSRGPGERPGPGPGPFRAPRPPHQCGCGAVKTKSPYDHAYDPDIRAARPRQLGNWAARFSYTPHPPPDPSGSRPPRAPWTVTRQATAPPSHPAAIISRCSATASGDARHCRCRGATPDTPRSAYRARGPGSRGSLGTSRMESAGPTRKAPSPAPLSSRRESDNHPLRSHFHSRLRSVL
jgi:hypothetical protein